MDWSWIGGNVGFILAYTGRNAELALIPVAVGLVVALPLGVVSARFGWVYPPALGLTSVLYALPSLALFVVMVAYTGLSNLTVIIPLAVYSLALLLPGIVDGIRSVPEPVRQAATAMGFGPVHRLMQVDLPLAVPVVFAGLRVATVSSISLVSVAALIGNRFGGLGYFFTDGEQRHFLTEIYVGVVLIVVLAFVVDGLLVLLRRSLTPWLRDQKAVR